MSELPKDIVEKYHIASERAQLVKSVHNKGTGLVDCWFESPQWYEHRCLTEEDFNLVSKLK